MKTKKAAGAEDGKAETRGRKPSPPATIDGVHTRAAKRFDVLAGRPWDDALAAKLRSFIGPRQSYASWNADVRAAKNLSDALREAARFATRSPPNGERSFFREWLAEASETGGALESLAWRVRSKMASGGTADAPRFIARKPSFAVRLVRFTGNDRVPELPMLPSAELLACAYVLLGYEEPRPAENEKAFFKRCLEKIRKAQKTHPKMPLPLAPAP